MSDFFYRHRHKISVELDSTNFCTGHDVPPAKYSSYQLLKLKARLFTQPVGWVETVRVRRPRASAFYQPTFCQSVRPTHPRPSGPLEAENLSPSDFHKRWNLIGGRVWCLSSVTELRCPGRLFFTSLARLVARWWQSGCKVVAATFCQGAPTAPPTSSQVDWRTYTNSDTTRDQISAKEKLHFLIYPNS